MRPGLLWKVKNTVAFGTQVTAIVTLEYGQSFPVVVIYAFCLK